MSSSWVLHFEACGGNGASLRPSLAPCRPALTQTLFPLVRERGPEDATSELRHPRQDLVGGDLLHQQEQGGRVRLDRAAELLDEIVGDAAVAELAGESTTRCAETATKRHAREGVEE